MLAELVTAGSARYRGPHDGARQVRAAVHAPRASRPIPIAVLNYAHALPVRRRSTAASRRTASSRPARTSPESPAICATAVVRARSGATSPLFRQLRSGALGGKCGRCEYRAVCGGCRARAFARGRAMCWPPIRPATYEPTGTRRWSSRSRDRDLRHAGRADARVDARRPGARRAHPVLRARGGDRSASKTLRASAGSTRSPSTAERRCDARCRSTSPSGCRSSRRRTTDGPRSACCSCTGGCADTAFGCATGDVPGDRAPRGAVWIAAQVHLMFAAFVLGVPMFAVVAELIGIVGKDDKLRQARQGIHAAAPVRLQRHGDLGRGAAVLPDHDLYPRFWTHMADDLRALDVDLRRAVLHRVVHALPVLLRLGSLEGRPRQVGALDARHPAQRLGHDRHVHRQQLAHAT